MSNPRNFRNRIVGHEEVAPDQLLAHPDNWRIHSAIQQRATEQAMNHIGWIDDVTVNRTTGRVIDGHMRVAIAMRRSEGTVPVKFVQLTEEEEKFALRTFDPLGELASHDFEKLERLGEELREIGMETDLLDLLDGDTGVPYDPADLSSTEAYDETKEKFLLKIEGVTMADKEPVLTLILAALRDAGYSYTPKAY